MEIKNIIIDRLEQLIKQAYTVSDALSARELAEYLESRSVIAAPVEIGQTVYQMLEPEFNDGEGVVCAWRVQGIMLGADGKFYAMDGGNEDYEIGSQYCRLTKAEAEEDLRLALIKAELGDDAE